MGEKSIRVRVPGTSANCGPGFDTIGIACTIYNELELKLKQKPGLNIEISGEGAANIPRDARNIVWRSIQHLLRKAHKDKEYLGADIIMKNEVPLSRGLGSSAAAIVAGLKAANILVGNLFSRREILQMATDIEGHPDNVAPAIFGGFTITVMHDRHPECFSFIPKLPLKLVVAVPEFPLSTRMARSVLPEQVPLKDAIFNVSRASLLVASLCRGNTHFLQHAFEDALHQPYRAKLIPGMYDVIKAAKGAGALGASMSGAGPCLIAFTLENAQKVGEAMTGVFKTNDIDARYLLLDIDTRGVSILH